MTSQNTIATDTVENILELERRLEAEKHVNLELSLVPDSKYVPQIIAMTKNQTLIYNDYDAEDPNFGYCKLRTLNKVLDLTKKMNSRVKFTINGVPYSKVRKVLKTHIEVLYERMHAEKNYNSDA